MSKGPEWARTGTIVGYAEYLRGRADAFAVLILRRDDAALAVHPEIAPEDARELLLERVPALVADLAAARLEKRKAARMQMDAPRE